MVNLFRRILIRFGKIIPFIFAFIVALSHIEIVYAIIKNNIIVDSDGDVLYLLPISNLIGNIVYIDWFDVLLLYILAFALEFCKYNMRAIHYLTLNLAVRFALETLSLDEWIIIPLCSLMALFGLYCVYGGFKIIAKKYGKY